MKCNFLTDWLGEIFPDQVLERAGEGRTVLGASLRKLTAPGCMLGPTQVDHITTQAPYLVEFCVHGNSGLAEPALITVGTKLLQLQTSRSPSSHFTPRAMSVIASLQYLHTLDVSYSACPEESFRTLATSQLRNRLTTLRASHVFRLSNECIVALLDNNGCNKLTFLDLSGNSELDNRAIEAIGRNLRELKYLNIEEVGRFDNTGTIHVRCFVPLHT